MKIKRADIDAAVAVEVMEWERGLYSFDDSGIQSSVSWEWRDDGIRRSVMACKWHPSTDANRALEAFEKHAGPEPNQPWEVYLAEIGCIAETNECSIPEAICLWLLAKKRGETVELED